jgi:hypothetical protein
MELYWVARMDQPFRRELAVVTSADIFGVSAAFDCIARDQEEAKADWV